MTTTTLDDKVGDYVSYARILKLKEITNYKACIFMSKCVVLSSEVAMFVFTSI